MKLYKGFDKDLKSAKNMRKKKQISAIADSMPVRILWTYSAITHQLIQDIARLTWM